MDDHVRLRPVAEGDLPFVERLRTDPDLSGPFLWDGWRDLRRFRRRWEEDGWLGDDTATLMVDGAPGGGGPLGVVSYRKLFTAGPVWCWSIGISLMPEVRGRGAGTRAQRLLVEYLFANTLAHRVQAETDVDNVAEQRALEKAGFTREGVIRGYAFIGGRYRDEVLYSILREEASPGAP
ncbi:GNAT family N-acetyltransferase [Actinomadura soli]|uniref:GNAT family N-acetyltransferase n=1 Tax=Actinomadura soli TaxID=2508997 RepID=A0A5C4IZN4_9ACTN|nr:GNAT family protein [Actinomadura soli]TMQ89757.1 GNAT family N-acetyltransferase [Actinomadura soli]